MSDTTDRYRECECRSGDLITHRIEEEDVGRGQFVALVVAGLVLLSAHAPLGSSSFRDFLGQDGIAAALLLLLGLDVLWFKRLGLLWMQSAAQKRNGAGYVRLDAPSTTLGGRLGLHLGFTRGFAGLTSVDVWLRCIDTRIEHRPDEEGKTWAQRVCYAVWEHEQRVGAADLPQKGEVDLAFALPPASEVGTPQDSDTQRYWEVEVVRRGGGTPLCFRVIVDAT